MTEVLADHIAGALRGVGIDPASREANPYTVWYDRPGMETPVPMLRQVYLDSVSLWRWWDRARRMEEQMEIDKARVKALYEEVCELRALLVGTPLPDWASCNPN